MQNCASRTSLIQVRTQCRPVRIRISHCRGTQIQTSVLCTVMYKREKSTTIVKVCLHISTEKTVPDTHESEESFLVRCL